MIASACARRGSQCGYFLAACVLFAALAFGASDVGAEEGRVYYKYTDDGGQLHIVQSLDRVPMQYRNQIGEIALEGDPVWTKITAPKRAPQPPAKYEPVKRRASRRKGAYDLRDVDVPRYGDELAEVSGSKSVPVLSVGGELIRGFNPEAYERALGG